MPFDIEAAKRGEPIRQSHYRDGGPYFDVRFVGVMSDGRIVVERSPNHIATTDASFLSMAPKKRTVYVNLYKRGCHKEAAYHDTKADALEYLARNEEIILARAVPIEIEE